MRIASSPESQSPSLGRAERPEDDPPIALAEAAPRTATFEGGNIEPFVPALEGADRHPEASEVR